MSKPITFEHHKIHLLSERAPDSEIARWAANIRAQGGDVQVNGKEIIGKWATPEAFHAAMANDSDYVRVGDEYHRK